MEDDKGPDAKIICVAAGDPRWDHVTEIEDVPEAMRAEIAHFFEVYKTLEPGKHSNTRGYEGTSAAWQEIDDAFARYPGSASH
jgi:inorganic pyrophosphatase